MSERDIRWNSRLLFGLVILTLGVLFTLDNFGIIDSRPILHWWPVILVAIGVSKLLGIGTSRNLIWGGTFTLLGALWLGRSIGVIHFDVWDLWPVFLVALGASFLFRGLNPQLASAPGGGDPADVVHGFAVMSGVERRIVSQSFRGGDVSAMMGGVELDLREAKFENNRAVIEVFAMWGGIDMRVPEDCRVSVEAFAIMGAIEDRTKMKTVGTQTLVIKGFVMMGGVEIKS